MNHYLEKVALTRLVRELAKSPASREKLTSLFEAGALRSPGTYANGLKTGNNALAKKYGASISVPKPDTLGKELVNQSGGYSTEVRADGTINVLHGNGQFSPIVRQGQGPFTEVRRSSTQTKNLDHQTGIRHELFEAGSMRAAINKGDSLHPERSPNVVNQVVEYATQNRYTDKQINQFKRHLTTKGYPDVGAQLHHEEHGVVGGHHSLGVLGRESELIRKTPYLHTSELSNIRKFTGENKYIERLTGKRYGIDKITGTDLKKLNKAPASSENEMGKIHLIKA